LDLNLFRQPLGTFSTSEERHKKEKKKRGKWKKKVKKKVKVSL